MSYYQGSYQNPSTDPPPPYNLYPPPEAGWKPSAPPAVPHGYYDGQTSYGVVQGQPGFGQTSYGVVQGQPGFGQTSYGVVQGQPGYGPPVEQVGYPHYSQQPPVMSPGWGPQHQPTHTVILTEEKPRENDRMAECFLLGCCSSILCCCLLDSGLE